MPDDDSTLEQLVESAQQGNIEAFEQLVARFSRTAFVIALAYEPDADAAEDIAQDALFKAWRTIRTCRDRSRFGSWLGSIVRRLAINAYRKRKRRQRIRSIFQRDLRASTELSIPTDEAAHLCELRRDLANAVQQLAPRQREVLLLHDLEGRRHSDIGETLGIAAATSRKHLSEARARVRQLLRPHQLENT